MGVLVFIVSIKKILAAFQFTECVLLVNIVTHKMVLKIGRFTVINGSPISELHVVNMF